LERHRDDRRGHKGQALGRADERAEHRHEQHVHGRDERRQAAIDDGPVDEDVDLVQPVPQDGDADRGE
jgi:hypothetical protein